MTADEPGLRERKRIRTRDTVRREAFRLFLGNGYAQTTVDQIAEAADISPRTFFRYFRTKEQVLVSDEFIEPIISAFRAAPDHLSPAAAYRHAVAHVFATMPPEDYEFAIARQRLLYTLPEARGALYDECIRTIRMLSGPIAERLGLAEDDFSARVTAGAITGVMLAAADDKPMSGEAILTSLEVLAQGLPR
jgi:AcrR family transcriptional regulator